MPEQLNPQQALIYAMVTTSAVDRAITERELERIASIVRELPSFEGFDREWLALEAAACGRVQASANGLQKVLDLIEMSLPAHLRETAYVLAAEVASSDTRVVAEEVRFLDLLAGRLGLDALVTAALDRAAHARHVRP